MNVEPVVDVGFLDARFYSYKRLIVVSQDFILDLDITYISCLLVPPLISLHLQAYQSSNIREDLYYRLIIYNF